MGLHPCAATEILVSPRLSGERTGAAVKCSSAGIISTREDLVAKDKSPKKEVKKPKKKK